MSQALKSVKAIGYLTLGLIPQKILQVIEEKAQFLQGKGWGAATTASEVRAISKLLEPFDRTRLFALDVGANVGNWTDAFINAFPKSRVVAFEPSSHAFNQLNVRFQNLSNVTCINIGLSDRSGEVMLFSNGEASALSSLHQRNLEHFSIAFDRQEKVRVAELDSWMAQSGDIHIPDVLKLDVEGHELSVLAGSKKTLEKVKIVQFEFGGGNIDSKTYFQSFWYFFKEMNFDLYRLTARGLVKVNEYSELLEVFRPTNYFAVRK